MGILAIKLQPTSLKNFFPDGRWSGSISGSSKTRQRVRTRSFGALLGTFFSCGKRMKLFRELPIRNNNNSENLNFSKGLLWQGCSLTFIETDFLKRKSFQFMCLRITSHICSTTFSDSYSYAVVTLITKAHDSKPPPVSQFQASYVHSNFCVSKSFTILTFHQCS